VEVERRYLESEPIARFTSRLPICRAVAQTAARRADRGPSDEAPPESREPRTRCREALPQSVARKDDDPFSLRDVCDYFRLGYHPATVFRKTDS
jgi:hypothetical protein